MTPVSAWSSQQQTENMPDQPWYQRYANRFIHYIGNRLLIVVLYPVSIVLLGCFRAVGRLERTMERRKRRAWSSKKRRHVQHSRLPPSQPLASKNSKMTQSSSFLCLPLEIRLQIYALALP